jgi:hypothetical protein
MAISDYRKDDFAGFLVTCLEDREREDIPAQRVLATRQVFPSREAARKYAARVVKARRAQVLPCPFALTITRG